MKNVEFQMMKGSRYTQERSHGRVPADFAVRLKTDDFRISDRARDVSECGVGLRTSRPLPPLTLVSLSLEVPHNDTPIDVLGRVMWATSDAMGLRFEQLDPRLSDSVERLRTELARP